MSRRKLSDTERREWERLARSVRPLSKFDRDRSEPKQRNEESATGPGSTTKKAEKKRSEPSLSPRVVPPPAPPRVVTAPARSPGLDQFGLRQVRRGPGLELRIDLHGLKQTEAHHRLLGFLRHAQDEGARVVLVITGKGREPGDAGDWWQKGERGVLRRAVPAWLTTPAFQALVAGFQPAGRGHGGDGAFYVQLRSRKRNGRGKSGHGKPGHGGS